MKDTFELNEYFGKYRDITENHVPGVAKGRYSIDPFGNIFDNKLNKFIKWTYRPDGYISVSLNTNGKPKSYLLHRIVGLVFVEGDTSLIINHKDTNKSNPHYKNLEWVTYSENNNHAFANDLNRKGEDSPKAVISENQVIEICKHLDEHKLTYSEIADVVGIKSPDASSLISTIYKGIAWRHISKDFDFSKNYSSSRYRTINRNK